MVFDKERDAKASGEEQLVDEEGHAAEAETETVPVLVHRNGTNGTGQTTEVARWSTITPTKPLRPRGRCSRGRSLWPKSPWNCPAEAFVPIPVRVGAKLREGARGVTRDSHRLQTMAVPACPYVRVFFGCLKSAST